VCYPATQLTLSSVARRLTDSRRWSAMFGGTLVSFVKRLFGRAIKSDDAADCQSETPASGGDCNGNVPPPPLPSGWHDLAATRPSTWTGRQYRHAGNIVLVCRRCGGTLLPSVVDPRRLTLSGYDDSIDVVCCCRNCSGSPCYYAEPDGPHPVHHPNVSSSQLNHLCSVLCSCNSVVVINHVGGAVA